MKKFNIWYPFKKTLKLRALRKENKYKSFITLVTVNIEKYFRDVAADKNEYGITKIDAIDTPSKLFVELSTSRPGICIGKCGREIDAMENYLSIVHNKSVKILIKETNPLWYGAEYYEYIDY